MDKGKCFIVEEERLQCFGRTLNILCGARACRICDENFFLLRIIRQCDYGRGF